MSIFKTMYCDKCKKEVEVEATYTQNDEDDWSWRVVCLECGNLITED